MDYKIALITGATGGIGCATAHTLAQAGIKLVLAGRDKAKMDSLIEELGDAVIYHELFDMTDVDQIQTFVNNINSKNIVIDILVNNAGAAYELKPIQEYDIKDVIAMVDLNVRSLLVLTTLISPSMVENNHGIIINMGSTAGQVAYANGAVYCATKSAVKTFSDGIRLDVMKSDVKVVTIMPGMVETDFSLVRFKGDEEKAENVYKGIEAIQPEDVAEAVLFAINQPKRCVIADITMLANQQGNGFTSYKK